MIMLGSRIEQINEEVNMHNSLWKQEVVIELRNAQYDIEKDLPNLDSVIFFSTKVMLKYHDRDYGYRVELSDSEIIVFAKIVLTIIDEWQIYDVVLEGQNIDRKIELIKEKIKNQVVDLRNGKNGTGE